MNQFDRFDSLAHRVRETGDGGSLGPLSTGERIYVALAADRPDLLPSGHSIVSAFVRLDDDWREELLRRWQYAAPGRTIDA